MKTRNPPFSNAKKLKLCVSNGDTISNLPDSILHHILSFLTMKQVVQTSVLSSRWRYLWTSLATLKFDSDEFDSSSSTTSRLDRFKDFVDKVLLLRDISNIKSFCLTSKYDCDVAHCVNTWVLVALRRNVQELVLDIEAEDIYRLPHYLFNCKSLTTLTLQMGEMDYTEVVLPDSMCLPALKTLHLESFRFNIEYSTNNLFSSCPVLESLVIKNCKISNMNLTISSPKLKFLDIDIFQRGFTFPPVSGMIKLYAPNLTWLSCNDYIGREYSLENLYYSLTHADIHMGREADLDEADEFDYELEADEDDYELEAGTDELRAQCMMRCLRALHNVKDLRLTGSFLELISAFPELLLKSEPMQFSNLKCLEVATWLSRDGIDSILYLLKISPNLETLSLVVYQQDVQQPPIYTYLDKVNFDSANTSDYWESGLPLECLLCPLKSVKIYGVMGSVNELKFLEILLKNVMALEELVVHTSKDDLPERQSRLEFFGEKLLAFPRASSSTGILFYL